MCLCILYMPISAYAHTHIQAHFLIRALTLSCARTHARTRMNMYTTHTGARAQTRMHPGTHRPNYAKSALVCVKSALVCVKSAFVQVKSALVCVKSNFVCVKSTLVCSKSALVCVKSALVCVKSALVCVKSALVCVKIDLMFV